MKQLYLLLRIENGIATYSSPNPQIRPPIDRTRTAYMSGVLIAQVARDLGINGGTLGNWVNRDRRAREGGDGRLDESEREELKRLRAENAELAMERDVLKRSVALWVKEAMRR
jgi:transposase